MAVATDATVLGDFGHARFSHQGVVSTFFRRDGRFFVNTEGPDGQLRDYEIRYTFGFHPLQQYLIEFPGGRLQALGIAWDARPKAQGGQRWYHLYPDRPLKPGEPLHWTGIDQVWNYQCADCHSTNLRKGYDEQSQGYATTWTDINVGCEACHGPGSRHLAWARQAEERRAVDDPGKGLTVSLDERRGVSWIPDPVTGNAARSVPRDSAREIEVCARCHARRGQFDDDWKAGDRFADGFHLSLLEPGLYYPDGQMREEVYNVGSLLTSQMERRGITCSDCHDPHSQQLRAPGNAVCGQCHAPSRYAAVTHHHHPDGSGGAECAACHMPTTTYMVVDPRHDHGFRIPRPDRTISLGVPNACNQCHANRTARWAAEALRRWYPRPRPGHQTFAEAFARGEDSGPGARESLLAVIADSGQSGLVRASAIARLGRWLDAETLPTVLRALEDADGRVRAAAVAVIGETDAGFRARTLPPRLDDPLREVRMDAARALAGEPEQRLSRAERDRFERALNEYEAAERFNADRPESRVNLGHLHAIRGQFELAETAYRSALALDPSFIEAAIHLAGLQTRQQREAEAEQTLREALKRDPASASGRHALGLSLVRQKRSAEALEELARAARLAPENPLYPYVYAVALKDAGQMRQAIRVLEAVLKRHPNDRDTLIALALFERESGRRPRALVFARRLQVLDPASEEARSLVRELGTADR